MKKIDMRLYKPYKKMVPIDSTRKIDHDKKITWPKVTLKNKELEANIVSSNEIDIAAKLWLESYPELYGGSSLYSWIFYPNLYHEKVTLRESWKIDCVQKNFLMVLVKDLTLNEFCGAFLAKKDDFNLQVELSLGSVHPNFRKKAKSQSVFSSFTDFFVKKIEKTNNVEYLTGFCETWHDITQYSCFKRWGFKIGGIFPGQYTRWIENEKEYRGCTVHFYKLLNDSEKLSSKPESWTLMPEVKKLWDFLENLNKNSKSRL